MLALRILSESGPDSSLSWMLLWALGLFFLIAAIGWLTSGNKGSRADVQLEAHEQQHKDVDEPVKSETKSPKLKSRRRK
ncbi:MAG: hypothetical protein M1282_00365 [Chloroflexi bacterium]|nr:hypothetical protein [Chloroflexota bacterium]